MWGSLDVLDLMRGSLGVLGSGPLVVRSVRVMLVMPLAFLGDVHLLLPAVVKDLHRAEGEE